MLQLQEEAEQLRVRIRELELDLELTRDELARERKLTQTDETRETVSGLVRSDTKHHDIEGAVRECHRSDVKTIDITG